MCVDRVHQREDGLLAVLLAQLGGLVEARLERISGVGAEVEEDGGLLGKEVAQADTRRLLRAMQHEVWCKVTSHDAELQVVLAGLGVEARDFRWRAHATKLGVVCRR